jgi:LysR family transcriptional regulator for metE and metH
MFLTQSALSHQLKELESRTGVKVFERINKKLLLTQAGRRVLKGADEILPLLTRLNEDIDSLKKGHVHTLRISTECYTCYHWLPPIISRLMAADEKADIQIVAAATQRPIEYLLRGELDLAIVSDKFGHDGVQLSPLFSDNIVAVVPEEHPFARRKKSLTAADFADQHLICYDAGNAGGAFMAEFFGEMKPRAISRIQLTEAIIEMISAGMGIGLLASWAVGPYLKSRHITTVPLRSPWKKRVWKAAYLHRSNPLVPRLITHIREHFSAARS